MHGRAGVVDDFSWELFNFKHIPPVLRGEIVRLGIMTQTVLFFSGK